MKYKTLQSHAELAYRMLQMHKALASILKPTDEQVAARDHLLDLAEEHARLANRKNLYYLSKGE